MNLPNPDRERVRIDELLLRRKAFLSYPANSKERNAFIKEAKQVELEGLYQLKNAIPDEALKILKDHSFSYIKGMAWRMAASLFCFGLLTGAHFIGRVYPWYVTTGLIISQVATFGLFIAYFKDAFICYKTYRSFDSRRKELDVRAAKILKDIEKLG